MIKTVTFTDAELALLRDAISGRLDAIRDIIDELLRHEERAPALEAELRELETLQHKLGKPV